MELVSRDLTQRSIVAGHQATRGSGDPLCTHHATRPTHLPWVDCIAICGTHRHASFNIRLDLVPLRGRVTCRHMTSIDPLLDAARPDLTLHHG
jgi:hypothetical protein